MTPLPFPEWRPDVSDYLGASSLTISNVLPRGDGYGPFPDFQALTSALPAACRGYFVARNADGTVTVFAGTSTRLWKLDNSLLTWIPVSKVKALTSISNATPAVFALNAHGSSINDAFVLSTTGGLPAGLTVGTIYYDIAAGFTANQFEASTIVGGTAVNTSSAGSGTHSFTSQYTALSSGFNWQFVQFNNLVFAAQQNAPLQVYDLTSATAFSDALGSPPQASYVTVINRFLVLSGLLSQPYRVQWSGLNSVNAASSWDNVTAQSNYQDLADGGLTRGVTGSDQFGVVFQDSAVRTMTFNPGSTEVFDFFKLPGSAGIFAPQSAVSAAGQVYFISTQGFKVIPPGGYPQDIGKEKFDRTFFADVDSTNLQFCIAAADPKAPRVYWAYKSIRSGSVSAFDTLLIYDYSLQRATLVAMSGEYIATLAKPGLTLENLDSISASVDALAFSLDAVSTAAQTQLSGASASHTIGFYAGSNLAATLQTAEQGDAQRRIRVQGLRPITDASSALGSVAYRETLQATSALSVGVPIDILGRCPMNISTRFARGQLAVLAGATWTYATGLYPEFVPEGQQ